MKFLQVSKQLPAATAAKGSHKVAGKDECQIAVAHNVTHTVAVWTYS